MNEKFIKSSQIILGATLAIERIYESRYNLEVKVSLVKSRHQWKTDRWRWTVGSSTKQWFNLQGTKNSWEVL